ncbi:MAG: PAS domain S-box protein [Candidatus Brocadiia bacterium]
MTDSRSRDAADTSAGSDQDLRQRAEALARERANQPADDISGLSPEEIREMLHELRVHQIELELQNEDLRAAQEEIKDSRARYRDLYDLAPVGYATISEKGLFLEANRTAAELLDTARGALVNQPICRFILKEDQDVYYLHRKKLFETDETQEFDLRLAKPDGAHFWAHLTATLAETDDGAPASRLAISDITELKQAEENREEIVQHLADGVVILNDEGTVHFANPAACRLFGRSEDELIGMDFGSPSVGGEMTEVNIPRKDGDIATVELRVGTVEWDGKDMRLVSLRDVSKRKKMEEDLKKIEWMLTKPFRSSTETQHDDHGYGDLTELNHDGLILNSVGRDMLADITSDYLDLLGTSTAVYEANGDYAYGIFSSGWCRLLDRASRRLCDTPDNAEALASGGWLCHECCWNECAKEAMIRDEPVDVECPGGLKLYGIPIHASEEVIGAINFAYGDPPEDPDTLKELARTYKVRYEELRRTARDYRTRPPYIIEMAKKRLQTSANTIGLLVERKRAEQEIAESRKMAQSTLDSLDANICVLDSEGNIVSVNNSWREFGKDNGADPARSDAGNNYLVVCESARGEDRETALAFARGIREVLKGERDSYECEYPCHSPDEKRWFIGSVTPIKNPGEKFNRVVVAHTNITDRKQAEEYRQMRLKILRILNEPGELEDAIQKVLSALKEYTDLDAIGIRLQDGEDFPYFAQKGFSDDFISEENSLIGRNQDGDICRDQDGNIRLECTCGMVISGKTDPDNPHVSRGGSFWTNDSSQLLDIPSEQDPRLNPRNKCVHQGYESVALVPIRTQHGIVGLVQFNDRREDRFTLETIELLEGIAAHIGEALMRKRMEQKLQISNRELHETLEELQDTQQQVVDQERRQALTQMASGIAHDFNNALSTIKGFTDMLLQSEEKIEDSDTVTRYLQHVSQAASDAAGTVRRMRKFYRPSEDKEYEPVTLNGVIEETVSMTEPRWKNQARAEGGEIEVEKDLGDIPPVQGDQAELHEMLTNLIFNAVDAMPEGGILSFKTREEDGAVVLQMRDSGDGMPEQVRLHCFDPFYTTKQDTGGSGLGLSTVQGVVERHNGRISVDSEEGEGTTFRIVLPVAGDVSGSREEEPEAADFHQSLTILVAEDEDEQRELISEYLSGSGHRIDLVPNGREGLARFMDGYYDLVITDSSMPEMNGEQFARQVKGEAPGTPVIMLTGFGDMMTASGETPDKVDMVLSKPVDREELQKAIAQMMDEFHQF